MTNLYDLHHQHNHRNSDESQGGGMQSSAYSASSSSRSSCDTTVDMSRVVHDRHWFRKAALVVAVLVVGGCHLHHLLRLRIEIIPTLPLIIITTTPTTPLLSSLSKHSISTPQEDENELVCGMKYSERTRDKLTLNQGYHMVF